MLAEFTSGSTPLLIDVPHAGIFVPDDIRELFGEAGRSLVDTDWHVHHLVDFAPEMGVSVLRSSVSRYVIDLNRGADDQPLYSGPTTGLVPTQTFDGVPLYQDDPPDDGEIGDRIDNWWRPYHEQLAGALAAIRECHGFAILLDAHSIRSRVPRLFDGKLPDLNLGTYAGRSCAPDLSDGIQALLEKQSAFSHVANGRFKGGYITRHYGRPENGVHALQLEIAQSCYMDEDNPEHYDETQAAPLKAWLRELVEYLLQWRPR